MSAVETHDLFHQIVTDFETLLSHLEQAIEALAHDANGGADLARLQRAKKAAERGVELARSALPKR